jgi:hypothetical protein
MHVTEKLSSDLLLKLAALLLGMALLTYFGTLLDGRLVSQQFVQANVWAKPLKFQLSMALQLLTVWWALEYLSRHGSPLRGQALLVGALLVTVIFEAGYITLQGARGVPSHFNRASGWESVASSLMAAGAYVLVGTSAWIGCVAGWRWLQQQPFQGEPMLLAIALGFGMMFLLAGWTGSALGQHRGPFVQPVPPNGITVPLTLWRLDVGDLRIAHFMGNHSMQALPLVAWLLTKRTRQVRHAAVLCAATVWTVTTVWLLQRALSHTGLL